MVRKKISHFIVKFIFRAICGIFIAAVVGVLLWRMISSGDPDSMKALMDNEKLSAAYDEKGESIYAFTQDGLDNITRTEYNYGYFSVSQVVFIDDAEQLQFVMRYNESTLKKIASSLDLEKEDRDNDAFSVTVTVMHDLTPNNKDDNSSEYIDAVKRVQYTKTISQKDRKNLYNYEKFVFDDIKITDDVIAVYVDIFYDKDVKSQGTLLIYDSVYPKETYKLTKKDIDNIK